MATTRPRRPAGPALEPDGASEPPQDLAPAPEASSAARPESVGPQLPAAVDAILRRAVEEAARLLQTDGAMAYLLDESTGVLRFAHDAGITDDRRREWVRTIKLEVGTGMFGWAVAASSGSRASRF